MKKEKKSSLDDQLNFDDLGTINTKRAPKKPTKKQDKVTGRKLNETGEIVTCGYVLGIPQGKSWYPEEFELKDVYEMTSEEFIRWARMVYPRDLGEYTKIFEDSKKRLKMLFKIVTFHKHSMFTGQMMVNPNIKH